jgi:hypothetical protein
MLHHQVSFIYFVHKALLIIYFKDGVRQHVCELRRL